MSRCHGPQVRLGDVEVLEARVAMSHAPRFGSIGDSLSDEYRFYPPDRSAARNWVEILAATRPVDFGAYTTTNRGLPRQQGFGHDWALSGATTQDVVTGQLAGMAAQVSSGKVEYVSVNMGTNDFLGLAIATAEASPLPTPAQFAANVAIVTAQATANLDLTVNTLLAASPSARVIVATLPDLREIPLVAQYESIPAVQTAAEAIANAEATYNDHIRAVAQAHPGRVAVADIAAEASSFLSGPATTRAFGGTTVRLTKSGRDYRDFTLGDQIHPGTIGQGLIANAEIGAANSLGATLRPLSSVAIVRFARTVARS